MAHEIIEKARNQYKKSEIDFNELHRLFFEHATKLEIDEFWNAPVFDRSGVIIGKTKHERDVEWKGLVGD